MNAPMTRPGPKMPPEPPEPMERLVARIRANGRIEDDPKRQSQELATEPLLDPAIAGAKHLGNNQGNETRR